MKLELIKAQATIYCLKHQINTMSVPFTKSLQNDGREVPSGSKELRERRTAKRRQFLYQPLKQRELNVEIVKEVSVFYNDIVPFAHLFSSGFVDSSWLSVLVMASRDPNEVLCDETGPIKDWRGRAVPHPMDGAENNKLTVDNPPFIPPLTSISKKSVMEIETLVNAI